MKLQDVLWFISLATLPSPGASTVLLPISGSHKFDVVTTSASLTDVSRHDPFTDTGKPRSIMVSGFYPTSSCRHKHSEPYMPPATVAFQDAKFAAYGLPNGSFKSLYYETCDANSSCGIRSRNPLPLVLFSGALGTSRLLYNNMLQSIAAAGYLVVSIDHPYDSDIVEFPDGTVITGVDISSDAEVELALATRAADIAFVHRQLANATVAKKLFPKNSFGRRVPRTAVFGHSLGGAAAAASLLQDPSLRGAVNLDGTMFGPFLTAGTDRPFMLVGHENKTQETDPSWKTTWPNLRGWKKEFEVKGAAHYSFSDLPLIAAVLGLQDVLPAEVEQVLGRIEGERMANLTVAYVAAFLEKVVGSGSEEQFALSSSKFSEVVEVA